MGEPLLSQLVRTLARPIGESERARARLHLLDWLACVAGARQSPVAAATRVTEQAWTFLGNLLEMDDIHRSAWLHPGPVIWPTVLKFASRADSADELLDAAVRGYEAMIALGATLDDFHYQRWHPTSTAGGFGAAAAAASAMALDSAQTAWAMANAASVAGGFWNMRHSDSMAKQWHCDNAVRTGLAAARNARAGLTGPLEVIEGPQGLHANLCREPGLMVFPDAWRIHEVSFKPWAACRHIHPAIDCALVLRSRGELVAPFVVETFGDALRFCDRAEPVTEVQAKFSLQHAIAVVAAGRNAEPADFTPAEIAELAPLRAQVTVREDPAISANYPAHFGARVNGFALTDARGDPERPVGETEIVGKLKSMVSWGGLDRAQADRAHSLAMGASTLAPIEAMLHEWFA